eukprot:1442222-Pyramimonas_sp.AAC.1
MRWAAQACHCYSIRQSSGHPRRRVSDRQSPPDATGNTSPTGSGARELAVFSHHASRPQPHSKCVRGCRVLEWCAYLLHSGRQGSTDRRICAGRASTGADRSNA